MSKYPQVLFAAALIFAAPAGYAATPSAAAPVSASAPAPPVVYPLRDMTMAEVRAQFGTPAHRLPPEPPTSQGPLKPPIERWIYPQFTVYFEHHRVIHTVLTHPREQPPLTHHPAGG
ncbi:MAG: hypothetical protein ACRES9_02800 [Gammaproteobacteria bacterium]